jgi:hypothetical protein
MAYTKTTRVTRTTEKSKTVVGRERLSWRRADGRLFVLYGNNHDPLAIVEPDAKYTGMCRIRFPDGGLSDMVNLTRAKDPALAFAPRSLNSVVQETPSEAGYVRNKRRKVVRPQPTTNRLHKDPNGFLAEGRS